MRHFLADKHIAWAINDRYSSAAQLMGRGVFVCLWNVDGIHVLWKSPSHALEYFKYTVKKKHIFAHFQLVLNRVGVTFIFMIFWVWRQKQCPCVSCPVIKNKNNLIAFLDGHPNIEIGRNCKILILNQRIQENTVLLLRLTFQKLQ